MQNLPDVLLSGDDSGRVYRRSCGELADPRQTYCPPRQRNCRRVQVVAS